MMWSAGLTDIETANILCVVGPTASGKTKLALKLAHKYNGEIINCDSIQLYKGFDIGSAKPTKQERTEVPHHLIDHVSWEEPYDAFRYKDDATKVIADIHRRGKNAILCGGTGLYLRALFGEKYHDLPHDPKLRAQLVQRSNESLYLELIDRDPDRADQLHPNDHFRLARALEVALLTGKTFADQVAQNSAETVKTHTTLCQPSRELLHERIAERVDAMLMAGLVKEVEGLLAEGCPKEAKPMQSIGYKQVVDFLDGRIEGSELRDKIIFATRQYAKRQINWFKKLSVDQIVE